ncbi:10960_t:CDS:2 [Ambispora gerdemannii]|uniref:10960_t:CDS:1 n=1 Tax=Ambispora gerdemannii TaxID=144530 RepID=A0A9N9AUQ8_9GLOM|nr:10960_t:CDS:2 [Ambispora gerdemannii]
MSLPSAEELQENHPDIETILSSPQQKFVALAEKQWVVKAVHHAETYFKLITAIDGKNLRLTPIDDEIYADFTKNFPDLRIDELNEDEIKSPEAKIKWREWMMKYEKKVEDYNFGTLLRKDVNGDYAEKNTILAIEIARNKQGLNSPLVNKSKNNNS